MAFYITNGMSVRQCACQLGINHATVYARLRKFGMLKPVSQADAILNPHIGDFIQAGGLKPKFTLLSVTQQSAGGSRSPGKPGLISGSNSNARKD